MGWMMEKALPLQAKRFKTDWSRHGDPEAFLPLTEMKCTLPLQQHGAFRSKTVTQLLLSFVPTPLGPSLHH